MTKACLRHALAFAAVLVSVFSHPSAHAGEPAPVHVAACGFKFCARPAWKGETIVRMHWWRSRTKNYTGIQPGSGAASVTLVPLAHYLFLQLQDPPIDEAGDFSVFCTSLRLSARVQDLP